MSREANIMALKYDKTLKLNKIKKLGEYPNFRRIKGGTAHF